MHRKPGYPVANCCIKMPDVTSDTIEEEEPPQRRQQLINFGHSQWGFNNWSWAVRKQDLDFVEMSCGKYMAGVASFVSVTVKTLDIHRENVGYATAHGSSKGLAIHRARKCAVTNALRETLLSFGGAVASELLELDAPREPAPEPQSENNPNVANKRPVAGEPRNSPLNRAARKEEPPPLRPAVVPAKNAPSAPPPVAKALPMPANLLPVANGPPQPLPQPLPPQQPPPPQQPQRVPPPPQPRPNSNVCGDSEEARAERRRRQRLAQEEFRLRQLQRQGQEDKQELDSNSTSVDNLLLAIPTQDIDAKHPGDTEAESAKRKSPSEGGAAKRRGLVLRSLDVQHE